MGPIRLVSKIREGGGGGLNKGNQLRILQRTGHKFFVCRINRTGVFASLLI
jgi:hypothetical protein